ncbi:MAG: F0F1 ATP synthase subunit A [Aeoliella sp.]
MADKNPLSSESLFEHVQDGTYFHVPRDIAPEGSHGHINIPQWFQGDKPLWDGKTGVESIDKLNILGPLDFEFTKFMILELVVAALIAVFFIGLSARIRYGGPPKGRFWNLLEVMYEFIRDQVARPAIGKEDGDKFLPFLLTLFFFILGCNLTGMIPWLGSPTGALATTSALAVIAFLVVVGSGVKKLGPAGFLKAQVPHMDLPGPLAIILKPMIFAIELMGLFIKHFVLAIRLLANMMAGHIVLAVIVGFIAVTGGTWLFAGVMPVSIVGAVALSMLELFVAFLQAYVFVFLTALFIGAAVHPH